MPDFSLNPGPADYARWRERRADAMNSVTSTGTQLLTTDAKPGNIAVGALLASLAIPLAILAALLVGTLGWGLAAVAGAVGMLVAFPFFALGARQPVVHLRSFVIALIIGTIATVLGAITGLLTDAYTAFVNGGGASGIVWSLFDGQLELPFPTQGEVIAIPLTITAVLAVLVVVANAAKALSVRRQEITAKARALATSTSSRLQDSSRTASAAARSTASSARDPARDTARKSANAANEFASHAMSINTASAGIVLNGRRLDEQESKKHLWERVRDQIEKAIWGQVRR